MHRERWRELQDLLDAAWSLAPEERAAYLDEHCADSELRAKAEALLAAVKLLAMGVASPFGDAHPATRRLEALVHATDPGSGH